MRALLPRARVAVEAAIVAPQQNPLAFLRRCGKTEATGFASEAKGFVCETKGEIEAR